MFWLAARVSLPTALLLGTFAFTHDAAAQQPAQPPQRPQARPVNAPANPPARPAPPAPEKQAAAPVPAVAAPGDLPIRTDTAKHEFWTVGCDHFAAPTPSRCVARMPVFTSAEMRQILVLMTVSKGTGDQLQLVVQLPTSISLSPGAELRFDDRPVRKVAVQSCEPALCTTTLPLDAALLADMRNAQKASLVWTSLITGQVRAEFPVKGAGAALAALGK